MVRYLLILALLLAEAGCSPHGWKARWHVFNAESALSKAHHLKEKKIPFEARKPYYTKACQEYVRAFEIDAEVFTLMRIEEAADACRKASLEQEELYFLYYEEQYSQTHPQEERYGDAGVGMIEI